VDPAAGKGTQKKRGARSRDRGFAQKQSPRRLLLGEKNTMKHWDWGKKARGKKEKGRKEWVQMGRKRKRTKKRCILENTEGG